MRAPCLTVDRSTETGELAVAASRLLGSRCIVKEVLSERHVPSGGTALVVALETAGGTAVVAKSGPPELVSAGVRAQSAAAIAAVDRNGVLRVPQVLAAEPGLAVSERAPGVPLTSLINRGDAGAVRLTGRALAELATLPSEGLPLRLADHVAELVNPQPDALSTTGLPRALAVALQELAYAALAAEAPAPAGVVHRDVHPRQLLVDPPHVWLLDWDLAACGDPALDLANLIQHSRYRLTAPLAEQVVGLLLEGYAPSRGILRRLPALEAFTAVRLACKAARLYGAAATDDVSALVARGRAALARGKRHG